MLLSKMLHLVPAVVVVCLLLFSARVDAAVTVVDDVKPNIVLIFCDNLGYGDIGCFGSKLHRSHCCCQTGGIADAIRGDGVIDNIMS